MKSQTSLFKGNRPSREPGYSSRHIASGRRQSPRTSRQRTGGAATWVRREEVISTRVFHALQSLQGRRWYSRLRRCRLYCKMTTERRSVCLCWARSKPKGPKGPQSASRGCTFLWKGIGGVYLVVHHFPATKRKQLSFSPGPGKSCFSPPLSLFLGDGHSFSYRSTSLMKLQPP